MRTSTLIAATATLLAITAGCGEPEDTTNNADAYASHLPDDRILVGLPTGGQNRAVGDTAESYLSTVRVSTDVNGMISHVLLLVDHVTSFEPTYSSEDDEYLWGPWNDGGLDPNETALYVRYDATEDVYGWAFIQRPKDSTSDDDWVPIIAGEAHEGDTEDTGSGSFIIDFDAIASLNPAEENRGVFASEYDIREDGVDAEAAFLGFSDDEGVNTIDAGYRYGQDSTGAGYMDLGYRADIQQDGSDLETIVLRTRWMADGAGRGDMVIFDGDLAPLAYQGSECWNSSFSVTYEENNAELVMDGDESTCVFGEPEWNDDAPEES